MLSIAYINRKVAPGGAFVMTLIKVTYIFPVLSNGNSYFSLPLNSNAPVVRRISLPGILNKLFSLRMKHL